MDQDNTTTGTQVPSEPPAETPDGLAAGVLDGGWSYIWAAYAMTWTFLLGYAVYVNARRFLATRTADAPPE